MIMKLKSIIETLDLDVKTSGEDFNQEVSGVYVSDLLSDVLANANGSDLWITLQVHPNIVAVAILKNLSCIVLVNNRQPEKETLRKANEEKIPILTTDMSAFKLAGKLYTFIEEK